jgi:hypothetical protein
MNSKVTASSLICCSLSAVYSSLITHRFCSRLDNRITKLVFISRFLQSFPGEPQMRRILIVSLIFSLFTLGAFAGQVTKEDKMPNESGQGCADVTSKLQNLTVGRMRVKTCCGGISLFAEVEKKNGKKSIKAWHLMKGNDELEGSVGLVQSSTPNSRNRAVTTKNGSPCFVVEKNVSQ